MIVKRTFQEWSSILDQISHKLPRAEEDMHPVLKAILDSRRSSELLASALDHYKKADDQGIAGWAQFTDPYKQREDDLEMLIHLAEKALQDHDAALAAVILHNQLADDIEEGICIIAIRIN